MANHQVAPRESKNSSTEPQIQTMGFLRHFSSRMVSTVPLAPIPSRLLLMIRKLKWKCSRSAQTRVSSTWKVSNAAERTAMPM